MRYILCSDLLNCFIIRLLEGIGQLGLAVAQPTQAHGNREYLIYHRQCLTLAGVEHTGKNRHQGQYAGTKISAFDLVRQRLVDKLSTVFATKYMLNTLSNLRLNGRYINIRIRTNQVRQSLG